MFKEFDRAINSFKDFKEKPEEEAEIQYYLGNFFFFEGLIGPATNAYEASLTLQSKERTMFELIKCYVIEKNLIQALEMLQQISDKHPDNQYIFDHNILNSLKITSMHEFEEAEELLADLEKANQIGAIFNEIDLLFYIGMVSFYLGKYESALKHFKKAFDRKYLEQE
jgi:tetratricopeptide (TPR) repeat protein